MMFIHFSFGSFNVLTLYIQPFSQFELTFLYWEGVRQGGVLSIYLSKSYSYIHTLGKTFLKGGDNE